MSEELLAQLMNHIHSKPGRSFRYILSKLPEEARKGDVNDAHPTVKAIKTLMEWNLIYVLDDGNHRIPRGKIGSKLTPSCKFFLEAKTIDIENKLGVGFGGPGHSIFHEPVFSTKNPKVFVLMPFAEKFRPIYDEHILKVTQSFGLECKRADDFHDPHLIVAAIWSAISQARIIIAECTGKNPNVFYEIGLAHALGKTTILLAQKIRDVPFDLQAVRTILYSIDTAKAKTKFTKDLTDAVESVLTA